MRKIKKLTRNYFIFSKKERNVALYLALAIVLITILPAFQKQFFSNAELIQNDSLQTLFASVQVEDKMEFESGYADSFEYKNPYKKYNYNQYSYPTKKDYQTNTKKNIELFEFDPNVISADQWIQLGISSWMAERILNYRNKGGKFKKKEDLLKTYGFKQEDYDRLEAFILIDTTNNYSKNNVIKTPFVISDAQELIEVNTAQKEQFMQLGFSADNAIRIIKFRETAGGIYSIDQLNSVFGIDMQSLENARTFLTVDKNHIIKININTVSFEQLANHVYISDELAQSIIDYRITTGKFYAITELMKVKGMYPSLFDKLKPYLIL